MSKEVVLIFDIGKTNKKILVFDKSLGILHEDETIFEEGAIGDRLFFIVSGKVNVVRMANGENKTIALTLGNAVSLIDERA